MLRTGCRCAALVLLLFIACKPAARQGSPKAAGAASGPRTRATVVEIKTTLLPANRTTTHRLVIANNKARSTAESQSWRLFDLEQNRVTRVDDIGRTIRHEPLPALIQQRQNALAVEAGERLPRAEFSPASASRPILGVTAQRHVVTMGQYRRELWVGAHPQIPAQLFAMMTASETPTRLAPIQRAVDEALIAMRGFPLADHAEVPYGNGKLVVDRVVTAVSQQDVPAALLELPSDYRELPPLAVTKPVAKKPAPRPAPPPVVETTATTATTATTDTTATTATATETFGPPTPPPTETTATTATTETTATVEKPAPPPPAKKKVTPKKTTAAKKPVAKKPAAKKPAAKKTTPAKKKTPTKKKKT